MWNRMIKVTREKQKKRPLGMPKRFQQQFTIMIVRYRNLFAAEANKPKIKS
jgi:hypothetical protein